MSLDHIRPTDRTASIEWPTLGLIAIVYLGFAGLVVFHAAIPLWAWLPLAALVAGWWGSIQHEILHGHPTRSRALNTALATLPIWLWLPFERYRQSHLTHHRDERLTDPLDDPESRYWTPDGWRELGPVGQALVRAQATLIGRLTIGPMWSIARFLIADARALRAGDRDKAAIWAWHALWTSLLLIVAIGVAGLPLWQYLLGFVYLGTAIALIRSFAEHRAHDAVEKRTAIVEKAPLFGLLFLNNNLHVVHHAFPAVPWYRIPRLYRDNRAAVLETNGGLVYRGYAEVFRRFFLRPHDTLLHPAGRVPERAAPQAGTATPAARASASQAKVVENVS